ncbi:MAG: serine/threonine-protein kinase [Planctomycetota bacterium]|jgi:serine/threonine protein kinase
MSSKATGACDERQLKVLLHGEEGSDEFVAAAGHVERCEACQARLGELAGDESSWRELHGVFTRDETFDDDNPPETCRGGSTTRKPSLRQIEAAALDVLAPPSHPEMLGRIGRYEVEKVVGSGGMGVVLKAHDTELNRPVAIKVLAPYLAHSSAARGRFAREGRAAAAVMHEHVVAIHNVESDGKLPYLVMQYVLGQSLQARVDQQGPLEPKEVLRIAVQVASGLAAAHAQGLVHRDVKPSNILLENDVERALLTDFGLARVVDDAGITQTGVVAGTPHYMSPEQAGGEAVDHRSDLFSLGAVLYFTCTGRPPFRADRAMAVLHRICRHRHRPAWQVNADVPDGLSDVIDRLLQKKPNRRPAGAAQVEGALAGILATLQEPNQLRTRGTWKRRIRRHRRAWSLGLLAALGAALTAAGIILSGFLGRDASNGASGAHGPSDDATPAPANSGEASPTDADVLESIMTSTAQLDSELRAVEEDLRRLETNGDTSTSFFQQQTTTQWHAEVEAVKRDLSRMEQFGVDDSQLKGEE